MKRSLLLGLSAALAPLSLAAAQTPPAEPVADEATPVAELIVTGALNFRNRTDDPNPVLSYDLEYFQRFEPVSVGEMLRRVPGVTFTSDVLEYDGVQLRGLSPEFTQILINGRRAPGAESDRSFFVDRIPAELVERIEIVRAPRADQPSEGVAGTLNVVLKEGASLEGGFVKLGGIWNEDGEVRPSAGIAYAGRSGETSFWAALNHQGRRNPKKKVTDFFDGDFEEPTGFELQDDTRDGDDTSANAEVTTPLLGGRLRLNGFYIDTDRDEDERSLTYEFDDGETVLDGVEVQEERISQQTLALAADALFPVGPGELGLFAAYSGFEEDSTSETFEGDLEEVEFAERETLDTSDDEVSFGASYAFGPDDLRLKVGLDVLLKERDGANRVFALDDGELEEETAPGAVFTIEEQRIDPYVRLTWEPAPEWSVDAGLRIETTERDVTSDGGGASADSEEFNPSLHLRYSPTGQDQFRASLARTVRRPGYDLISPFRQEEEPADGDEFIGNPTLADETAWGIDVGYERRLGPLGVFGVNVFYRDIQDLIELVDTGEDVLDGGGENDEPEVIGAVYTADNIGDGTTWGVELDFNAPLTALGLPDTGVFANYTYLDSETTDPFTGEERRFRNQPQNLFNIGFIHTIPSIDASFGANLSGRDEGFASALDEEVITEYDDDLEVFVEKRFGGRFVVRFTAANLLDREKRETFRVFDGDNVEEILEARAEGDVDESEAEREASGRLFQLTVRAAF